MVAPAFAQALENQRDTLNARFAEARRLHRGLDGEVFKQFLLECVEPVVVAISEVAPSAVDRVMLDCYRVGLTLVGGAVVGPSGRHPSVQRLWAEAFPHFAKLIATDASRDTIAALSNAVCNLDAEGIAHPWIEELMRVAPHCGSPAELLSAGKVLAWRLGLAHYRDGALHELDELRADLARVVVEESLETARSRWVDRGVRELGVVTSLGNFVGLGGGFRRPPIVLQVDGQLYVSDGDDAFSLHADKFGATLKRCGHLPDGPETESAELEIDGSTVRHTFDGTFDLPDGVASVAIADELAAFTLEHSHRVFVVAPVPR